MRDKTLEVLRLFREERLNTAEIAMRFRSRGEWMSEAEAASRLHWGRVNALAA